VTRIFGAILAMFIALTVAAWAHEGHLHKIMGTVSAIQAPHLEVKAADGKVTTVMLDDGTKVVRGTTVIKATDLKAGDRVVVSYMEMKGTDGAEMLMAKEVKVGAAPAAPAK
jgi:hypothetical protein